MEQEYHIKKLLSLGSNILACNGHNDLNQGQISVRSLDNSEEMIIKRGLCGFANASPTDMIRAPISPKSNAKSGLFPPELPLHQAIYQNNPIVKAIVHSHAYYSVIFGATNLELKPISHEGAIFVNSVAKFTTTSHTILDSETAEQVSICLGKNKSLLMQNHGMLVVGGSIQEAVVLAILFEKACKIQLSVEQLKIPYSFSHKKDVEEKKAFIFSKASIHSFWQVLLKEIPRETIEKCY